MQIQFTAEYVDHVVTRNRNRAPTMVAFHSATGESSVEIPMVAVDEFLDNSERTNTMSFGPKWRDFSIAIPRTNRFGHQLAPLVVRRPTGRLPIFHGSQLYNTLTRYPRLAKYILGYGTTQVPSVYSAFIDNPVEIFRYGGYRAPWVREAYNVRFTEARRKLLQDMPHAVHYLNRSEQWTAIAHDPILAFWSQTDWNHALESVRRMSMAATVEFTEKFSMLVQYSTCEPKMWRSLTAENQQVVVRHDSTGWAARYTRRSSLQHAVMDRDRSYYRHFVYPTFSAWWRYQLTDPSVYALAPIMAAMAAAIVVGLIIQCFYLVKV